MSAADDELEALALELAKMYQEIWEAKKLPKNINKPVTQFFAEKLWKGAEAGLAIEYEVPDSNLIANLQKNVYQFAGAKNYQQMKAITEALVDNGKRREFAAFKEAALNITSDHMGWLKTEYNTAVAGGQMASKWVDIQNKKEILPYLQFDAVMDGQTTELCAGLNKVTLPVDDPFWNTYYPPNHFNCRSTVRQLRSGAVTDLNEIEYPEIPAMFQTNLAKENLIFPKNSAYFKDVPKSVLKESVSLIPKKEK
ncbi:MAG: minor capsid protein [Verrucomicrobia bacterium]|nr:minor capsid protein [Verrucomicrobiota bacterium]